MLLSSKVHRDFEAAQSRAKQLAGMAECDLARVQLERISEAWADAVLDVPYYGNLVTIGRAPARITSWADFHSIPILTRQVLQDRPGDFVRRSGPADTYSMTAGSTGNPFRFGMYKGCRDLMRIVKLSAWMQFGYTPASRLFLLWGHSHLLGTGLRGRFNHVKRKLSDALLGYKRVDAYRLDRKRCEKYAERLLWFRPLGIIGYSSALHAFGKHTVHLRDRFHALKLKFVLATAEPPPNDETLSFLSDLFGCPVVQEYGGAEFGQVAFKTGEDPFEVYSDLNYLECGEPVSEEEFARPAMVTTLYRRYFPLFRYRVGDALVGVETMTHGHVLRFDAVAGRINDMVKFSDGTAIHSVAIFHCIHQERAIHSIQMVIRDDGIEILLAGTDDVNPAVEERIRQRLTQVYRPLGSARITRVEDLVTNRAGKRRWFVDERTTIPSNQ